MIGRAVVIGLVLVAAVACGGSRRPAQARERTVLIVDNKGFTDMTVYVVVGTRRTRVGIAGGLTVTELTIPPHTLGNGSLLSFVADPMASNRQSFSQEIYVRAGDRITLTIPP